MEDLYLDNTLIQKKSPKNIWVYAILYKTLVDPKPLRMRFYKINGFIRIYDGNKYLTLPESEEHDPIYNRMRYIISLESGITYISSQNFAKIKIDSFDSLPIEKILTLHHVMIHIKSVLNKR